MENYATTSVAGRTGHLDGRQYGSFVAARAATLAHPDDRRRPGAAYAPVHDKIPSKGKNYRCNKLLGFSLRAGVKALRIRPGDAVKSYSPTVVSDAPLGVPGGSSGGMCQRCARPPMPRSRTESWRAFR